MAVGVTRETATLLFSCNICGKPASVDVRRLTRDAATCQNCGSTPRARAIIRLLSTELFGDNLSLPNFPLRREIRGLGMTDWKGYAVKLAERFDYRNTYYHKEPKLDISVANIASELLENDFIIASDIFEHVAPPVGRAFANAWKMLKTGGVLILTVPYGTQAETIEHFPELYEFSIVQKDGSFVLRNRTKAGVVQEFNDLVFHGGLGSTLEMRVFSETALIQHLTDAGFVDIKVHRTADLIHGVWWPEPWSLPISARKPTAEALQQRALEELGAYSEKFNAELSRFQDVEKVHALPEIYHYWSTKYLLPKLCALGFDSLDGFFVHYISESCNRRKPETSTIVSLGSGNCDYEVYLARRLCESGVENFHFVCLEMNGSMLKRGETLATNSGLSNHFSFIECDLNNWRAQDQFDSILAIHSIHHVVAIEKLFDEVHRSLSDDGTFLINDMIGRNGHMRWPEALEVVQAFWKDLPHSKKYNHQLKRFEDEFVNWDCSTEGFEGIRAQDILPRLIRQFQFDLFLGFANVIDIFIDRSFGHNFDPKNESDIEFIDRVAMTDQALLESGKIKPTHMIAALKKQGAALKTYKHLTPEFCVRWP